MGRRKQNEVLEKVGDTWSSLRTAHETTGHYGSFVLRALQGLKSIYTHSYEPKLKKNTCTMQVLLVRVYFGDKRGKNKFICLWAILHFR